MNHVFRIEIVGTIPDANHDLGAEAVVATKAPSHAIVEALEKMGLTHVRQTRRVVREKVKAVLTAEVG